MEKKWILYPKVNKKISETFKEYPPIIRQLLYARKITILKDAENFLDPGYINFESPGELFGIEKFSSNLIKVIKSGEKLFIHGDYDVDGICSTSLLWDFLYKRLNADVLPFIPSRFTQGYGMTDESLNRIWKDGGRVVITVDCGIRDDKLIRKWKKKGMRFFITDHHSFLEENGEIVLPEKAEGVLHPAHPKGRFTQKELCGTAVAWKLTKFMARKLALDFDPDTYLDLVALATVCDIMPLSNENRSIVKEGLKRFQRTVRIGLKRLLSDAGVDISNVTTYDLGFTIGPRLNASGRIDHALDAVRLLVTDSYSKAREISGKLQQLNLARQQIQQKIYEEALEQIKIVGKKRKLFFVWGDEWQEGVVGIVAGKLSETFNRPVLIATKKEGKYTGSARSTPSFNIIEAISTQSILLERFGGHAQAAGFTVEEKNIEKFRENLVEIADQSLADDDLTLKIQIDSEIKIEDISWELLDWIQRFSPFGFGNPTPKFLIKNLKLTSVNFVGQESKHLKLVSFNCQTKEYIEGIGFGLGEEGKDLRPGDSCDLVFTLESNEWNGTKRLQMNIKDLKT